MSRGPVVVTVKEGGAETGAGETINVEIAFIGG